MCSVLYIYYTYIYTQTDTWCIYYIRGTCRVCVACDIYTIYICIYIYIYVYIYIHIYTWLVYYLHTASVMCPQQSSHGSFSFFFKKKIHFSYKQIYTIYISFLLLYTSYQIFTIYIKLYMLMAVGGACIWLWGHTYMYMAVGGTCMPSPPLSPHSMYMAVGGTYIRIWYAWRVGGRETGSAS